MGESKNVYRRQKFEEKKGKGNFKDLVQRSLSTQEGNNSGGLTRGLIRKFSRRARQYILAYYHVEHDDVTAKNDVLDEVNIERLRKRFKTHRSAIDFDEKFIKHTTTHCTQEQKALHETEVAVQILVEFAYHDKKCSNSITT